MGTKKQLAAEPVPAEFNYEPNLILDEIEKYIRSSGYHIQIAGRKASPSNKFIKRCRDYAESILADRAELYFELFISELIANLGIESIGVAEKAAFDNAGIDWSPTKDPRRFRSVAARARKQLAEYRKNLGPLNARKGRPPARTAAEEQSESQRIREEIKAAQAEKLKAGKRHGVEAVKRDIADKLNISAGRVDHVLYPRRKRSPKAPRK